MEQLRAGERLDRYELLAPLGQGGQGTVWSVRDVLSPQAPRAVKLIDLAAATPEQSERARREARQLAALSHPSIVACHGLFEDLQRGLLGLVTSLVEGQSLRELLADPRFDQDQRLRVLDHLGNAMSYVHERAVVHRDIKLDNVMIGQRFFEDPDDPAQVQLIDFGTAVTEHERGKLTRVGYVVGTAAYLAPELLDPMAHGPSSSDSGVSRAPALDVFAFGVVAWQLLVGGHPTGLAEGSGIADYTSVYRHLQEQPERWLSELRGCPFQGWLAGCLALNPRDRIRSGVALRNAMSAGREGAAVPITLPLEPSREATLASAVAFTDAPTDEISYVESSQPGALAAAVEPRAAQPNIAAGQYWWKWMAAAGVALLVAVVGVVLLTAGLVYKRFSVEPRPALSCQPGELLPPEQEVLLWVDAPTIQERGVTRAFDRPGESVCLTNRRTRQRKCVSGSGATISVRVADVSSGAAGLEIELRRKTQSLLRTPPLSVGPGGLSCADSDWLLNVDQGVPGLELHRLQLRPR